MSGNFSIALLLAATAAACGTTDTDDSSMGVAARVTGNVSMFNPAPDTAISGLKFNNVGANDVTVFPLSVTLVGGTVTNESSFGGFGVPAGEEIDYVFDIVNHDVEAEQVTSISFRVDGTTELVVDAMQETGCCTPGPSS